MTTQDLMAAVVDEKNDRDAMARLYAQGLQEHGGDRINWTFVNRVIVERWSQTGLAYIKREAWRIVEG